jgi:hypothetical protein
MSIVLIIKKSKCIVLDMLLFFWLGVFYDNVIYCCFFFKPFEGNAL